MAKRPEYKDGDYAALANEIMNPSKAVKINTDFVASSDGNLGVEASDAGLKPGEWPGEVKIRGIIYQRKNRDPYGNMMYIGSNNQLLVIFND